MSIGRCRERHRSEPEQHNLLGYCKDQYCKLVMDGSSKDMCYKRIDRGYCSEGFKSSTYNAVGIYTIMPPFSNTSFPVRCEMKFGGRTMVQYRDDVTEDFYRNWTDYRNGFGSLDADFWLGLEKIRQIVKNRDVDLVVFMKLGNGSYYQQRYFNVSVSDESDGYRVMFSHSRPGSSFPLGDSLSYANGSQFTTLDVDNDNWAGGNCAQTHKSGFWFNACTKCNPNGRLLKPADGLKSSSEEVFWTHDLGNSAPYKTKMWLVVP
ncbi:angiopoietin-related protein 1-like [Gigantopelta aegis]|uniref:angiopoietin-related protein 1-like n=1 Tax=Gigantopelta aegis TaxID=1735272 RepID=UPI001B88BB7C|nr:angiopoietin-related protein 1-like [Gigantopelta aegis]